MDRVPDKAPPMTATIQVTRLQRRCYFSAKDSLRWALSESYIADVVMESEEGELTIRSFPAALFLLSVIEECALAPLATDRCVEWPIPERDANISISTSHGILTIMPLFEGDGTTGVSRFALPIGQAINLFYTELCRLLLPDREEFEKLSPFVGDHPVIRRIFGVKYT